MLILYFSVFCFFSEDLGISTKIPVFDANPSNYSFIRGLKRKKLQFWTCFALYVL